MHNDTEARFSTNPFYKSLVYCGRLLFGGALNKALDQKGRESSRPWGVES
ncbi:hypothetical protein VPMS16_209 [Vibrio sp. 16]|nr:hypothetical protein VPMS16_209 [Vibrio sp. 16]